MQKADRPWRMTVDSCKLQQVVTQVVAIGPDTPPILVQINMSPDTWHAAIDPTKGFSIHKDHQNNVLSVDKNNSSYSGILTHTYKKKGFR